MAPVLLLSLGLQACRRQGEHTWYSQSMTGYFDTLITLVGYTRSAEEFDGYFQLAEAEYARLHKLFDIYNDYPGGNNLKTVNDKAGVEPVAVDSDLLDIVEFAKDWALSGDVKTNIALGPVLAIWHRYRTEGLLDPENAALPPVADLAEAAKYTNPADILVDRVNGTLYLARQQMSLDVGAIAKGYATELVAEKLAAAGLTSGALNAGGNVRTIGRPLAAQNRWGIGIMDPEKPIFADDRNLDTVYVVDSAVVSSGDYQRFYYVEGVSYHHLIDPDTFMPANFYRALTVVTTDSGLADLLSTELYLLPYSESRSLAESLPGVEVLWLMFDGEIRFTPGMVNLLRSQGASDRD